MAYGLAHEHVWHVLVHGLAHGRVWPLRRAHGLDTRACGRHVTQVSIYALFSHSLGHGRVWSRMRHISCSHRYVTLVCLKFL
ncbi:hypothetical protein F383_09946 [Gossypium arboreum]|uniref:Uncharacterized protein n=1 Tax=Gossypium arboreum TaxID=29729 RepID=A0A0B0PJD8_GOSAR|nr:hypothetical protein F383_09946 [Gossypium arboreum]